MGAVRTPGWSSWGAQGTHAHDTMAARHAQAWHVDDVKAIACPNRPGRPCVRLIPTWHRTPDSDFRPRGWPESGGSQSGATIEVGFME